MSEIGVNQDNPVPRTLKQVEPESIEFLVNQSVVKQLPEGAVFIEENSPCNDLIGIRSGLAVCEFLHPELGYVPFLFLTKNKVFMSGLTKGAPSTYQLRTITNATVNFISVTAFIDACATWPKLALCHAAHVIREANAAALSHARAVAMPLDLRLAFLMWDLVQPVDPHYKGDRNFPFFISQTLLAKYFGSPREEISRKLKLLQKKGLIVKHERGLRLLAELETELAPYGVVPPEPMTGSDLYLSDIGEPVDFADFGTTAAAPL